MVRAPPIDISVTWNPISKSSVLQPGDEGCHHHHPNQHTGLIFNAESFELIAKPYHFRPKYGCWTWNWSKLLIDWLCNPYFVRSTKCFQEAEFRKSSLLVRS